jgi:NAD(P)-dependent dehydrogenase (short-subunit alcohol dehydrogenase family)
MNNKLCTIIGFGPGIGLAVARAFAGDGFALALLSRNPEKHAGAIAQLGADGTKVRSYAADAADEASLHGALELAKADCGPTSVLVYNAFAFRSGKPMSLTAEQLTTDFRTNVGGALTAARAVAAAMREAKQGTMLFTGGGLALDPMASFASVAVGKAGLRNLVFSLAQELTPAGIHVATVTVCGMVRPGTRFDPDTIAQRFLELHQQEPAAWQTEIYFK